MLAVIVWTVEAMIVAAIIVGAAVAVAVIGARSMGVAVPPWFIQILWILVIAVVCVAAVRFLFSL